MTESPEALQASKRIDVDPTGSTCRSDRIADMSRRISYWRGSTRLRVTTVEDATQDEVASFLQRLAAKQLELDYLRASEADTPESPEIRTNRHGAKLWTIGKDFHYTVEWFASGTPTSRSGIGDYPKPTAGELTRRAGRARWIGIPFSVAPADCEARRDTELITCTKLAQKTEGKMAPIHFVRLLGVDTAVTDAVSVRFQGADGKEYTANIAPAVLPATIAALIARGSQIGAGHPLGKGVPVTVQPLLPTGFSIGSSEDGTPIIFFHLGRSGALPFRISRPHLKNVQSKVAELIRLTAPPSAKTRH